MLRPLFRGKWCAHLLVALLLLAPAVRLAAEEPKPGGDATWRTESLNERRIRLALADPTTLEFIETPLKDVVDYLKDLHGIEIQVDTKAMDGVGVSTDTPVTRVLKGISLRSALRLILRDLDLTYVVRDDVLQITTPEVVNGAVSVETHSVADLIADEAAAKALTAAVELTFDPPDEAPEGGKMPPAAARVVLFRGLLLVRGNLHEQERVGELLSRIRRELKGSDRKGANLLKELNLGKLVDLRHLHLRHEDFADLGDGSQVRELRLDFNDLGDSLPSLDRFAEVEFLSLNHNRLTDKACAPLASLAMLTRLDLADNRLTGRGLATLGELQNLRWLSLTGNPFSDAGLAEIGPCKRLEWLSLSGTQVTAKGLAHLKRLENLQILLLAGAPVDSLRELPAIPALVELDLRQTTIKDVDLEHLRKLKKLKRLNLCDVPISDMGLVQLASLSNLRRLAVGGSRSFVSQKGYEELRRALPGCEIVMGVVPPSRDPFGAPPPADDPFGEADPFK